MLRAPGLYGSSTRLDCGDTMILAAMGERQAQQMYSYDTEFDGIAGVIRLEP